MRGAVLTDLLMCIGSNLADLSSESDLSVEGVPCVRWWEREVYAETRMYVLG